MPSIPAALLAAAATNASSTPISISTFTGSSTLDIVSSVIGWTYFVAWSASFYPQVLLNYRRKFVGGLSIDFIILNLLGHTSYSIYNLALYANENVRGEYRRRHNGADNAVRLNDVAFSVHATMLTMITFFQTVYYPRAPGQRLSLFNRAIVVLYIIGLIVTTWAVLASNGVQSNVVGTVFAVVEEVQAWTWLDVLGVMSVFKLYVSVGKYVPQAWANFERQSTDGWSIENVLLDFTGGVLSFTQLFLDSSRSGDWSTITGNPAKFGLSVLSAIFSTVFMTQHYILYPDHETTESLTDAVVKKSLPQSPSPSSSMLLTRSLSASHGRSLQRSMSRVVEIDGGRRTVSYGATERTPLLLPGGNPNAPVQSQR
ncbi:PQ-loop-domain-containing protein [Clavulina sp. PMI_390]|nr:PQ-loop-domain-containing protein [Clavulina sp. PMI_390]